MVFNLKNYVDYFAEMVNKIVKPNGTLLVFNLSKEGLESLNKKGFKLKE